MTKQDPPILALQEAFLRFGDKVILDDVSLGILPRDRVCLVGRNGCGKSTLLKILTGQIDLDDGDRFVQPRTHISLLGQSILPPLDMTALEYIQRDQPVDIQPYEIEEILSALQMAPQQRLNTLSGGEGRRVALAKALVLKPEVLLLDEPTNHLDMPTIEWLEGQIRNYRGAVVMISHDRAFLRNLSQRTLWLDRGILRTLDKGYTHFDEWSEKILEIEESEQERLKQKIAQEMVWLHKGVTARRKRNMGRLRQLQQMRKERAHRTGPQGSIEFAESEYTVSSKQVVDARHISKAYGDKKLIENFSTRIQKADRIGIIGPNGSGKTTLIKILTGQIKPDSGKIKVAKTLEMVKFEQDHSSLKPNETPWENLCPAGGDQVMVQNQPRHVMGYLQDFLFDRSQARSPIKSLSGGEKNRLLLAKILAKPSNLLVLDEPTNDLDMDSLDLLQEYLDQYPGTLIIVSHDRDFLDRTTTSLIAVEGDGNIQECVGGYSDYLRAKKPITAGKEERQEKTKIEREKRKPTRLSYKDARDREMLPDQIADIHRRMGQIEEELADPSLFQDKPDLFHALTEELDLLREDLDAKEHRWLEIEMVAENLEE